MARKAARINRVVNRLLDILREIDGDGTEWLTHPKTVRRARSVEKDMKATMPAIFIHVEPSSISLGSGPTWIEAVPLVIETLSKHVTTPEDEAADVSADVRKALRAVRGTLTDPNADDETIAYLSNEQGWEAEVDPDVAAAGLAGTTLRLTVTFHTDETNP